MGSEKWKVESGKWQPRLSSPAEGGGMGQKIFFWAILEFFWKSKTSTRYSAVFGRGIPENPGQALDILQNSWVFFQKSKTSTRYFAVSGRGFPEIQDKH